MAMGVSLLVLSPTIDHASSGNDQAAKGSQQSGEATKLDPTGSQVVENPPRPAPGPVPDDGSIVPVRNVLAEFIPTAGNMRNQDTKGLLTDSPLPLALAASDLKQLIAQPDSASFLESPALARLVIADKPPVPFMPLPDEVLSPAVAPPPVAVQPDPGPANRPKHEENPPEPAPADPETLQEIFRQSRYSGYSTSGQGFILFKVQKKLELTADGKLGPKTRKAIKDYQRKYVAEVETIGLLDDPTLAALELNNESDNEGWRFQSPPPPAPNQKPNTQWQNTPTAPQNGVLSMGEGWATKILELIYRNKLREQQEKK